MTTFAAQPEAERRLAELEARTRNAWSTYREDLRDLTRAAYHDAEAAAWDQLQAILGELESERATLVPSPPTT